MRQVCVGRILSQLVVGGEERFLNPIPPGLFEGGLAWGGGGGDGNCPQPIKFGGVVENHKLIILV